MNLQYAPEFHFAPLYMTSLHKRMWFGPHVRQQSFVEIGYEIISIAILSTSLIQEGQLSVTGERMCTKYW